jgi:MoaA/NifB/PqqE/SkfB family radical SAM enzyme
MQAETLLESVRLMRLATGRGTINLNSNGSRPEAVKRLREAGLDSIRVSLNSCRPESYNAYFRPRGFTFEDAKNSIKAMKDDGGFASINYFVFPGFTDSQKEIDALCGLIEETGLDLIQMRNLNIDPEWYIRELRIDPSEKTIGIRNLLKLVKEHFPGIRFGYFNPCLDKSIL